jgi:hypothetical protein
MFSFCSSRNSNFAHCFTPFVAHSSVLLPSIFRVQLFLSARCSCPVFPPLCTLSLLSVLRTPSLSSQFPHRLEPLSLSIHSAHPSVSTLKIGFLPFTYTPSYTHQVPAIVSGVRAKQQHARLTFSSHPNSLPILINFSGSNFQ